MCTLCTQETLPRTEEKSFSHQAIVLINSLGNPSVYEPNALTKVPYIAARDEITCSQRLRGRLVRRARQR